MFLCKIHHIFTGVMHLNRLLDVHIKHAGVVQVVLLVDDVVPGPDGHQVGVVCGGGDGHGPGAPGVGVAQLVGQVLQLVRTQVVVVPQTSVVGGTRCSLDTLVGAQIEVILGGMGDVGVHGRPCGNIPRSSALVTMVGAEEAGVVTLLDHDEGDSRLVVSFQLRNRTF